MSTRTEWHLAELSASEADPFATAVYSTGVAIDLDAPEEELFVTLRDLLAREGRMEDAGLRCELKDGGQDCRTCPAATLDPSEARSRLCRLGKDQVAVAERARALAARRQTSVIEMARLADECSEMGHLDADLAEMLTAVGL